MVLSWITNLIKADKEFMQKETTFTREPWGIAGEPSALLGKKISQTPKSLCLQIGNAFKISLDDY